MNALLRPDPARGHELAAGVVALTVFVTLLSARFDEEWGAGIHLVYSALAAGFVIALASQRRTGEGRPAAWQAVLFIAAFVLCVTALSYLGEVLGAEDGVLSSAGTVVWVGTLVTLLMAWLARLHDSGISTLLAAIAAGVTIVAFVDWVFSPEEPDTFRWVLLAIAVGYGVVAYMLQGHGGPGRRASADHGRGAAADLDRRADADVDHANGFVNAAGLALLGIAIVFAIEGFGVLFAGFGSGAPTAPERPGTGWELAILVGSAALIFWAITFHRSGPGYLAAFNLGAFAALASAPSDDGPSLIGWPLVLGLIATALLALALRPGGTPLRGGQRRGSPSRGSSEPPAGRDEEPPARGQEAPDR